MKRRTRKPCPASGKEAFPAFLLRLREGKIVALPLWTGLTRKQRTSR